MSRVLLAFTSTLLLAACSGTRPGGAGAAPRTAVSTGTLASGGQIDLDVEVRAGDALAVRLESAAFDSFLRVVGPDGSELTNDDYGAAGVRDAFVYARTPAPGTWRVEGRSYVDGGEGAYRLVTVAGAPVEIRGTLAAPDPAAPGRSYADAATVAARPGDLVVADLATGDGLDGYVYAVAADGGRFENDDWESSREQAVAGLVAGRGPVTVVATAFGAGAEGTYTLYVLAPSGDARPAPGSAVAAALGGASDGERTGDSADDDAPADEPVAFPMPVPRTGGTDRDDTAFGEVFDQLTTSAPDNFGALVGAETGDPDDLGRHDASVALDGALESYFSRDALSGDFTFVGVYADDLPSEAEADAVVDGLIDRLNTVPFACDPYTSATDRTVSFTVWLVSASAEPACAGHRVEVQAFSFPDFSGSGRGDTWNVAFRIRKTQ